MGGGAGSGAGVGTPQGFNLGTFSSRCIKHLLWQTCVTGVGDVSGTEDTGLGQDVLANGRVHVQMLAPRRLDAIGKAGNTQKREEARRPSTDVFSDEFKAQASTRAPV